MSAPSPQSSVLLLERSGVETAPTLDIGAVRASPDGGIRPFPAPPVAPGPVPLLRAPGLAMLAAVSVLEGYRWLGIIANGGSRPWTVVVAGLVLVAALALTRTDRGRHRPPLHRLVVSAAAVTALATVAVLLDDEGWATIAVGIADLTLASTAMVALVAGERSRRRGAVAA